MSVSLVTTKDSYTFAELLEIMQTLLGDDGCPWDRKQTLQSLKRYLVEETYEVIDAIDTGEVPAHRDELGDLLFQVVFQSAIRERAGQFAMADVVTAIAQKLVRRHPHVFGEHPQMRAEEVPGAWNRLKAAEKAARGETRSSVLDGVPRSMPPILRALRMQERVAGVGFDWDEASGARDKLGEELAEVDEAVASGDPAAIRAELGDLMLAAINYARLLDVDPDAALQGALGRFDRRFRHVEAGLAEVGKTPADATLAEMEALWQAAKKAEE